VAEYYRTFTPDLEVRSKGDGRTIVGIAVPWDKPTYIGPGLTEQFRSGAFNEQLGPVLPGGVLRAANKVFVAREHMLLGGELIGRASLLRNDAAGLYTELRVSRTERGDETLELVKDGALTDLSIMFREGTNAKLRGGITERVSAELVEIAVVLQGAYGDQALVSAIRAAGAPYAGIRQPAGTPRLDQARQLLAGLPKRGGNATRQTST
jgi:HK97 family phage prohead protease